MYLEIVYRAENRKVKMMSTENVQICADVRWKIFSLYLGTTYKIYYTLWHGMPILVGVQSTSSSTMSVGEAAGPWIWCGILQISLPAQDVKGATIQSPGGGGGLEFLSLTNCLFQPGSAARCKFQIVLLKNIPALPLMIEWCPLNLLLC